MQIYLDTCTIQRPLDTPNQTRIRLEAEAILGILALVEAGVVKLISSTVLELEVSQNSLAVRREHGEQILRWASSIVMVNQQIAGRAAEFNQSSVQATDALHLAAAEAAQVDYFCTCDDRFLRRAKRIPNLQLVLVSPLELIARLES
jgi:predicted nucleic acid-binding protein